MANGTRILIIDDEPQIRRMLKVALTAHDFEISEAGTGQEGLNQAAIFHPDLVILDLGLPDMDGIEVIQKLREWSQVPVLILSVREVETEKIKALDSGADDFITKPFYTGELLARIRVALRHVAKTDQEPVITFGDLIIDMAHRMVTVAGQEVKLTPTEYDILKNLALHAGKVLTHRQLLKTIWGTEYQDQTQYLRVYIGQLRHKIEPDPTQPRYLITEPGVGYRLAVREE
ncbi:MAG TPA: response regulator [Bacillota bacterium]|nr:response regulator [Bacillota bacterium]